MADISKKVVVMVDKSFAELVWTDDLVRGVEDAIIKGSAQPSPTDKNTLIVEVGSKSQLADYRFEVAVVHNPEADGYYRITRLWIRANTPHLHLHVVA